MIYMIFFKIKMSEAVTFSNLLQKQIFLKQKVNSFVYKEDSNSDMLQQSGGLFCLVYKAFTLFKFQSKLTRDNILASKKFEIINQAQNFGNSLNTARQFSEASITVEPAQIRKGIEIGEKMRSTIYRDPNACSTHTGRLVIDTYLRKTAYDWIVEQR